MSVVAKSGDVAGTEVGGPSIPMGKWRDTYTEKLTKCCWMSIDVVVLFFSAVSKLTEANGSELLHEFPGAAGFSLDRLPYHHRTLQLLSGRLPRGRCDIGMFCETRESLPVEVV